MTSTEDAIPVMLMKFWTAEVKALDVGLSHISDI